jgi:protein-tyrosine phosphatase
MKIFWITKFNNSARLGIMARPRGDDWLQEDIIAIKKGGVEVLVSLLEEDEINELGLIQEERLCKDAGINYMKFPIKDRNIPKDNNRIDEFISALNKKITEGASVVIHCRMGIGRSSIIAGAILLSKGMKTPEIIKTISKARGYEVPDTEEQLEWLKERE